MKFLTPFLASAVILTGCASASKTFGPDGRETYNLNCSGTARNWNMCLEKAGEICGAAGYDVVRQDGGSGFIGTASRNFAAIGSTVDRTMQIACKR